MPAATGSLWRNRQFTAFWSGETISQFGDRISELALPLIAVTMLAATPAEVGLLTAAIWRRTCCRRSWAPGSTAAPGASGCS